MAKHLLERLRKKNPELQQEVSNDEEGYFLLYPDEIDKMALLSDIKEDPGFWSRHMSFECPPFGIKDYCDLVKKAQPFFMALAATGDVNKACVEEDFDSAITDCFDLQGNPVDLKYIFTDVQQITGYWNKKGLFIIDNGRHRAYAAIMENVPLLVHAPEKVQ